MSIFRQRDGGPRLPKELEAEVSEIAHNKAFHFYREYMDRLHDSEARMAKRVLECEKVLDDLLAHFSIQRVWVEGHYEFRTTKGDKK